MLYDYADRPIAENSSTPPKALAERIVHWEPSDRTESDASRALTPSRLDGIFRSANRGDPRDQAKLAEEIEEKNWDMAQAIQTRRAAVLGLDYSFQPRDAFADDSNAKRIAGEINRDLDRDMLHDVFTHMLSGLLSGYACHEIVFESGGKDIAELIEIDGRYISFNDSLEPLLISTNHPEGKPLVPGKFVFHRHRARSGDATRGGLIRPLGWMYLFVTFGMKDLLRFIEKFGMPFVSARLDDHAWKQDRNKIAYLIRNFGSDGGGVFSKNVELEMLEAPNNTGEVYFKLLEYMEAAITKVVQGQTATSGDAGGFSKGQAQENVRTDLMEADCKAVAKTVQQSILAPLTMYRYGPDAPVPELVFDISEPEDREKESRVLVNLSQAGWKPKNGDEVSQKFGIELEYTPPPQQTGPLALSERSRVETIHRRAQMADEAIAENTRKQIQNDSALYESWQGPIAEALAEALAGLPEENPTDEDISEFRDRLSALMESIPDLFAEMDSRALAEHIAQAMFAGDINGRVAALNAAADGGA